MTTRVQDIVDRAAAANLLNAPLVTNKAEMLAKVRELQRELFTATAENSRNFFQTADTLISNVASSGRILDLSSGGPLTRPLERIVRVAFSTSDEEINQVDQMDLDAEYAPRYTMSGYTLTEVGNDWGVSALGVSVDVTYCYGPTDIDPAGELSQVLSVPDNWAELLTLPLQVYLIAKDPGRPDKEMEDAKAAAAEKSAKWFAFVQHYGGIEARRFSLPTPGESGKK